jgi:hypothetical protein
MWKLVNSLTIVSLTVLMESSKYVDRILGQLKDDPMSM